jgi:protein O-GlcNAc transferase
LIDLDAALAHHEAGRLAEAEALYHALIDADPRHAGALHLLGVLAHQTGRRESAIDLICRAIAIEGGNPAYHNNLGTVLLAAGDVPGAIAVLESALAIAPHYPEALSNLGNALKAAGRSDEAGERYREALRLKPDYAEAWFNFGNLLQHQGRFDQAVEVYRQALTLRPSYAEACNNLGTALLALGDDAGAVEAYGQAIRIAPGNAGFYTHLGNALHRLGRLAEAEAAYRQGLVLKPDTPEALNNLGNALQGQGRLDEAIQCYRQAMDLDGQNPEFPHNCATALKQQQKLGEAIGLYRRALDLRPDHVEALSGLGSALEAAGRLEEAIPLYRRALDLRPGFPEALNHLLFALNSAAGADPSVLLATTRRAVAAWGRPAPAPMQDPAAGVQRAFRIGYVSADLRSHPVGHFLAPVLAHHDPGAVEVFCYSNNRRADDVTRRLQTTVPHWRDIAGLDDRAAHALIRQDRIDILVDLSGHTADHRLPLFLSRPAPLQLNWLGYFGTTGLEAIDYVLADGAVVPEADAAGYSEGIWRLPGCYLCFDGGAINMPVAPPPVEGTGRITFGCFNRHDKLSAPTLALWAEILRDLPEARLVVKNTSLADETVRADLSARLTALGIAPERVDLEGPTPRRDYLAGYGRIDIALDPFPFGGGTTTAETLWMGVPVVALRGKTWPGRISASMLAAVGLADLVAETPEAYRTLALDLARDRPRLAALRAGMRARVETGLCDGAGFTRGLEAAYKAMWDEMRRRRQQAAQQQ